MLILEKRLKYLYRALKIIIKRNKIIKSLFVLNNIYCLIKIKINQINIYFILIFIIYNQLSKIC